MPPALGKVALSYRRSPWADTPAAGSPPSQRGQKRKQSALAAFENGLSPTTSPHWENPDARGAPEFKSIVFSFGTAVYKYPLSSAPLLYCLFSAFSDKIEGSVLVAL